MGITVLDLVLSLDVNERREKSGREVKRNRRNEKERETIDSLCMSHDRGSAPLIIILQCVSVFHQMFPLPGLLALKACGAAARSLACVGNSMLVKRRVAQAGHRGVRLGQRQPVTSRYTAVAATHEYPSGPKRG